MLDMRYPKSKIKEAIFHAEEEVRLTALGYFADSFADDESIMPFVIEVVEKYGRASAFRVLRDAERLPQTEATLDWLVSELRRDYTRGWEADGINPRLRQKSELLRLTATVMLD